VSCIYILFQTCFLELQGKSVLAVLSSLGVQLWSLYGDNMLFYFPLNSLLGFEGEEEKFVRGVTAMRDFVCVGVSTGNILVFKDGGSFPLVHNLESDKVAISALASSSQNVLIAANDSGRIFGYSASDAFEQIFALAAYNSPVTCLCMRDTLLLAGFASGHIRGFRTDIVELTFEITAHTRAVTGMSLSPAVTAVGGGSSSGFGKELVSCSADQFVHVWGLPDFRTNSSCRVDLLYSSCLEHKMCTGAAFLSGGDRICIAAYDEEELVIFRKMK
jgi:WD40 repeat protein